MAHATILTSPNGVAWTVRVNPWDGVGSNARGVANDGSGDLVACAGLTSGTTSTILQSTNGVVWLPEPSPVDYPDTGFCVAYDAMLGLWVVGGNGTGPASIVTSSDRISWTQTLASGPSILSAVALGGGFCAGAQGGVAYISSTGTSWTPIITGFSSGASPTFAQLAGLAYDGTTILAVGFDGNFDGLLQVSTNGGLTWTTVGGTPFSGPSGAPNFAAYGNGTWIVGDTSSGTIMTASSARSA